MLGSLFRRAKPPAANKPQPFDPLDPDFVRDPYPFYKQLREADPIHRAKSGAWVLTRYDDVAAALANPMLGNAPASFAVVNARNRDRYVAADVANNTLPFLDDPAHGERRRIVGRAFAAHLKSAPVDMAGLARETLSSARTPAGFDVIGDFATLFSVRTLCRFMGVPDEDGARLKAWSASFFYLFGTIPSEQARRDIDRDLTAFRAYFQELIEERRSAPRDDLVSALIAAEAGAGGFGGTFLADTCVLIFSDGVENVDSGVGSAVAALSDHPRQMEMLRADPALMPRAVDELLRYDSPAQHIARIARQDLDIGGLAIRGDSVVLLALASANRDPAQFDDPDQVDITREKNPHLSFGRGRHSCIGAPMVRMQMEAALAALLAAAPGWRRLTQTLEWQSRPGHRWLKELRISLDGPSSRRGGHAA